MDRKGDIPLAQLRLLWLIQLLIGAHRGAQGEFQHADFLARDTVGCSVVAERPIPIVGHLNCT